MELGFDHGGDFGGMVEAVAEKVGYFGNRCLGVGDQLHMRETGLQPKVVIARTEYPLDDDVREKLSLFSNVSKRAVIEARDVEHTIYELPLMLPQEGLEFRGQDRRGALRPRDRDALSRHLPRPAGGGHRIRPPRLQAPQSRQHPWFITCQFHPEFRSRPREPHPLFKGFIAAALAQVA